MRESKKIKFVTEKSNKKHGIIISSITVFLCLFIIVTARVYKNSTPDTVQTTDSKASVTQEKETDDNSDYSNRQTKKLYETQAYEYENENDIANDKDNKKLEFIFPIAAADAVVSKEFSINELIYSNTMEDWRIHNGIDILCSMGSEVRCAEDGEVKLASNDVFSGYTITIEHLSGYETVYSNLANVDMIQAGGIVKKGEIIGTVGDSAATEIMDAPHLHFEIIKDGEHINPSDYISK